MIRLPEHYGVLSPILHVLPLQLLVYHTATARGRTSTNLGIWPRALRWVARAGASAHLGTAPA